MEETALDKITNTLGKAILYLTMTTILINIAYIQGYRTGKEKGIEAGVELTVEAVTMEEVLSPDRFSKHYQEIVGGK